MQMKEASLLKVLSKQKALLAQLVRVLKKERDCLITRDSESLLDCGREKEGLKKKMEALEEERLTIVGNLTLRRCIEQTRDSQKREKWLSYEKDLKVLIREGRALNNANDLLYRQQEALLRMMADFFDPKRSSPYSADGELKRRSRQGKLINGTG